MHFNFNDRPTKKNNLFFWTKRKTCNVQNVFGSVFIDFDVVVWVFDCFFFISQTNTASQSNRWQRFCMSFYYYFTRITLERERKKRRCCCLLLFFSLAMPPYIVYVYALIDVELSSIANMNSGTHWTNETFTERITKLAQIYALRFVYVNSF